MHPVLEILLARRARADRPGDRRDPHRVVLAVEGGSRATFSGGMVAALAERGLSDAFDAVYGSSAGTVNGAWFVAGGTARGVASWHAPGVMRRVTGLVRTLAGRPVVDMRWVVDHLVEPDVWRRVLDADVPLHPLATDADTGDAVDLRALVTDTTTLTTAVRASTHLPVLGGPPVALDGRRFLDAALAETLPFRTPLAQGATHVVLLRTRRADDPPRPPGRGGDLLARALLPRATADAWRTRTARQRADDAWLAAHRDTVLPFRPPPGSPDVTQRATDEHLLHRAVEAGRRAVLGAVPAPTADPARA